MTLSTRIVGAFLELWLITRVSTSCDLWRQVSS